MPDGEWEFSHERNEYVSETGIIGFRGPAPPKNLVWWNHMPAAMIKRMIGEETWSNYFKFCVVRNPFDKAVSAFYHFQRYTNNPAFASQANLTDMDKERADFEAWVHHSLPIDRDKYLIDGKFCLDDFIRYEALPSEMERICHRLSLPWDASFLPTLKSNTRPKQARTESLYTEKSKKIVSIAYAFELNYFGYSFPDNSSGI